MCGWVTVPGLEALPEDLSDRKGECRVPAVPAAKQGLNGEATMEEARQ